MALLRRTYDSQKLIQRFSIGRGSADDLLSLGRTIEVTKSICDRLSSEASEIPSLQKILSRLNIPTDLARVINNSIDEEGLILQQKIEETETADLAAINEAAVSGQEEKLKPDVIVKQGVALTKENDTSGYFESRSGIIRPEPWLMMRK